MNKEEIEKRIVEAVNKAREIEPLTPSITNTVTINFVANAILAVGGSAAMIYLADEAEKMAESCGAFYINAGTFFPFYEETLPAVSKKLKELKKPWVLDPVGIGIGGMRTEVLYGIKENPPTIVRGNASEIIALSSLWGLQEKSESTPRGVDSTEGVEAAYIPAIKLAKFIKGAVMVSGERDLITDGKYVARSEGGSKLLKKVTGAGCSLGGVAAVYSAVAEPFIAALTATALYNYAGKTAEKESRGPASFYVNFLDSLYMAEAEEIAKNPFELEEIYEN